ncbi:MAG TPA: putative selenate ABC transporter substrate-binding protein [Thermodesulfobacteriota bacterium]|nr:putative selenate ABC transporter substrate-binding protein [Thermodesulfobacteriota bacterium]
MHSVAPCPAGARGRLGGGLAVGLALLLLAGPAAAYRPAVLRVSAIPDEAPTELLRKFEPLGAYLKRRLGMDVRFVPVADYAATVEALAAGQVDLVWYGGFTYVQARLRTGNAVPLVMRREDLEFKSYFIAGADTGIKTLADLKGRTFSFGSVSSTSGSLMPRYFLMRAGIVPERDFARVAYSGAHDATVKAVEGGRVDAGVVNYTVFEKMVAERKVDPARVRVFWVTPPYADYNWTVRGDLDDDLKERIAEAFLALDPKNPEHRVILELQRASGFVRGKPELFAGIEEAARAAGLLK